jgi:hypothetical protein
MTLKRTKATELPSYIELKKILSLESLRKPNIIDGYDFRGDNSYLIEILQYFNLDFSWVNLDIKLSEYMQISNHFKVLLVDQIVKAQKTPELVKILHDIFDYLTEEDSLNEDIVYDKIFVFGSSSYYRTDTAIDLLNKGVVNSITISGHKPFYKDRDEAEAITLANYAIQKGINPELIETEPLAITIPDNVKRTIDLWESKQYYPEKIIIVSSPFVLRRCLIDWQKFYPRQIEFKRKGSLMGDKFSKTHWYNQQDTCAIYVNELIKILSEFLVYSELKA